MSHRVIERRQSKGWSQVALAKAAGVSRTQVSAIENGRLVPSVAAALRIAQALGDTVEHLFADGPPSPREVAWAWQPRGADGRAWQATVSGRATWYPVESTAEGALPHDGWFDERGLQVRPGAGAPERTLVVAGCDPLVSLLSHALTSQGIRILPLIRSSRQALELLREGVVHAAGVHFADAHGHTANDGVVRATLGRGHRLLHQVRWDTGIAVVGARHERTPEALLRAKVRWVNREEGSAARQAFDMILASRRRPAGYEHVVRDHRAVATTVASGWAEAGVCVRPAATDAQLSFIPLHREAYELCVPEASFDDPRIVALLGALRSTAYRQRLADVPGCEATHTGDVRAVA